MCRQHFLLLRLVVVALALAAGAGCSSSIQQLPPRDNTLLSDKIVSTCPEPGEDLYVPLRFREARGPEARELRPPPPDRPPRPRFIPRPPPPPPPGKLHPALRDMLSGHPSGRAETLLVTLRETLRVPTLPALDEQQPRSSAFNQARLLEIANGIDQIRALRDSSYDAVSLQLAQHYGATVLHRHWLTHSMLVSMPLSNVPLLIRHRNVVYVEPAIGTEPPPSCPTSASVSHNLFDRDDPETARAMLQTDAYRALGLSYGYMSLLDTGICPDHCLLSGVSLGVAGDCVNGGLDCMASTAPDFDTRDQYISAGGHGTASAAILVGNRSLGESWGGALDIVLDYFQVFSSGDCGTEGLCLNADAATHAFESSLANGDRIILAELSSLSSDWSAVGMSAQNAFGAGAVVIAANGNKGPASGTVTSPASAPCVLGVGAWDLEAQGIDSPQSRGPAFGNRIKPDFQAPTGSETAKTESSDCSETGLLGTHAGTSGATPFAGAVAALLRNWMNASGEPFEPGNVYAGMILCGRHSGDALNQDEGAGLLELPTDGCAWWGQTIVMDKHASTVSLDLTDLEVDSLEVAIWWPEDLLVDAWGNAVTQHNNVDLLVYDPADVVQVRGNEVDSVFERVTAAVESTSRGVWTLRFEPTSLYTSSQIQPIYWMAAARKR